MTRTVITVPGLHHGGAPFPIAVRTGSLLVSSALTGQDPDSGTLVDDVAGQTAAVFANISRVVTAAGGSLDDIAKVTIFLRDLAHRTVVNAAWTATFPDPANRPTRHTLRADLPEPLHVQADIIAVISEEHT